MDEELVEFRQNFEKANSILMYIFLAFNISILLISIFFIKPKLKRIKKLRYIYINLIVIDSISIILYAYLNNTFSKKLIADFINGIFLSIEFYLIISFFIQIFYNSSIPKLSKKIKLMNPLKVSFFFLIINLPYNSLSELYQNNIIIFKTILFIIGILLLYRYLNNKELEIGSMINNQNLQIIYYYLNFLYFQNYYFYFYT